MKYIFLQKTESSKNLGLNCMYFLFFYFQNIFIFSSLKVEIKKYFFNFSDKIRKKLLFFRPRQNDARFS